MKKPDKILMEDYTPGQVVYQGVEAVRDLFFSVSPARILDPSAGSGVFGQVFRQVWPKAHTIGVEPKRGEAWYLRCNYDQYAIQTFQELKVERPVDLVCTNPPFHSWEFFVEEGLRIVRPKGYVVLLGLTSWGSRSMAGSELFDRCAPVLQMRILGALSFRSRGNDARDYCWWVFQRAAEGRLESHVWPTLNLPRLESSDRQWGRQGKPGRVYGQKFQTSHAQHPLQALGRGGLSCSLLD